MIPAWSPRSGGRTRELDGHVSTHVHIHVLLETFFGGLSSIFAIHVHIDELLEMLLGEQWHPNLAEFKS
jgi:hypothetical protein